MKKYSLLPLATAGFVAFAGTSFAQLPDTNWTSFQAVSGSTYETTFLGNSVYPDRVNRQHSIIADETITAEFVGPTNPGYGGTFVMSVDIVQTPGILPNVLTLDHGYRGVNATTGLFSGGFSQYGSFNASSGTVLNAGSFTVNHSRLLGSANESTISWNFDGLENGVLPAGTLIYFQDVDIVGVENVVLTAAAGSPAGWASYLGYYAPNGASAAELSPTIAEDVGARNFTMTAQGGNSGGMNLFITTEDIKGFSVYNPPGDVSGGYFFGILAPTTAMPVPEPTATLFLGMAGVGALHRRRRR